MAVQDNKREEGPLESDYLAKAVGVGVKNLREEGAADRERAKVSVYKYPFV